MSTTVETSALPLPSSPEDDPCLGASAQRKASLRLLPIISIGYGLAYMDRINISFASLRMNSDLHFSATVYGLGAGLFFIGYALCEVPSNLLLLRFGPKRWLARIMLTWGLLAAAMMFVRTPLEFYLVRLLLGMAEAGFFPGVIYYLTLWFPADARPRSEPLLYCAAAELRRDGLAGWMAAGPARQAGSCRLAVALSAGRLAGGVVQLCDFRVAARQPMPGTLAHAR